MSSGKLAGSFASLLLGVNDRGEESREQRADSQSVRQSQSMIEIKRVHALLLARCLSVYCRCSSNGMGG